MSRQTASRILPTDAASAFTIVADIRNHVRWIPVTRASVPSGPHGPLPPGPFPIGTRFTMLSAPGIVDRMEVTALHGPTVDGGATTLRKAGPILLGTAGIEVTPLPPDHAGPRCLVTWWEDVHLAGPAPRCLTDAALGRVILLMLWHALRHVENEFRRTSDVPSGNQAPHSTSVALSPSDGTDQG